jgi:PAS domain S-box-containing protein
VAFTNTILDTIGALVIVLDKQGRIVRWNRACERVTGCSFEEVRHRCFWDQFLIPEEVESVKTVFEQLRTTYLPNKHENYWVTKNGDRRLIEWSNAVLREEDGTFKHIIATGVDITERKQAMDDLRWSEERVRLLLDSTAEGIFGTDTKGNVTFANPACLRLLGFDDPSQLSGQSIHTRCHHTRADGTPYPEEECRGIRAIRRAESVHVSDELFWRSDGTAFAVEYWAYPMLRNGEVVGGVVTFLDIT